MEFLTFLHGDIFFSFYLMGGALPQAGGGPFVGVWLGSVQRGVEGETPGWAAFWGPSPPLWRPWLPRTPLTGTFLLFPDEPPERQLRGGLNLQVRAGGARGLSDVGLRPKVQQGEGSAPWRGRAGGASWAAGCPGWRASGCAGVVWVNHWGRVFWVETLTGDVFSYCPELRPS